MSNLKVFLVGNWGVTPDPG